MDTLSFTIKDIKSSGKQPVYITIPYELVYKNLSHLEKNDNFNNSPCLISHYVTGFIGSKNLEIQPVKIIIKNETNYIIVPYVIFDSRWYIFKYKKIFNSDDPDNLPPNSFLYNYITKSDGKYIVQWKKLTSDGSVFIKASVKNDSEFWNGIKFLSNDDVEYTQPNLPSNFNEDFIYLKTKHYIDIIRNTIFSNSLSILYKKYIDECLWKSTFLFKRIRGSYCFNVAEDLNHNIQIGLSYNEKCNGGCVPCWELIANAVKTRYEQLKTLSFNEIKTNIRQKFNTEPPQNLTWIDYFDYNWSHNLGYNLLQENNPPVEIERAFSNNSNQIINPNNIKLEVVRLNINNDPIFKHPEIIYRQNKYYGIDAITGERKHHSFDTLFRKNITNKKDKAYAFISIARLKHKNIIENGNPISPYKTLSTEQITNGAIEDGKQRIVVPPGVIFRTFKAVTGIVDLHELDTPYRRPDEFHFAVDNYGNILGTKTLPFPALLEIDYPNEPYNIKDIRKDENYKQLINNAWDNFLQNTTTYTLFNQQIINNIYQKKLENHYYLLGKRQNIYYNDHKLICSLQRIHSMENAPDFPNGTINFEGSFNLLQQRKFCSIIKKSLNSIFIIGGLDTVNNVYLNSCEKIHPTNVNTLNFTSSFITPMHIKRCLHSAILLTNNLILVAGGYNDSSGSLNSCELYNTNTNVWVEISSMKRKRTNFVLINHPTELGKVLAIGGYEEIKTKCGSTVKKYHKSIEVYDLNTNKWTIVKNLKLTIPREDFTCCLIPYSTKILVYGGYNENKIVNKAEILDVITNTSEVINQTPRRYFTVEFFNNAYHFIGGLGTNGPLKSVEKFVYSAPNTYYFEHHSNLNIARFGHSSEIIRNILSFIPQIGDNTIIVGGGSDGINTFNHCEVLNQLNNQWTIIKNTLIQPQVFGYAFSLQSNIQDENIISFFGGFSKISPYQPIINDAAVHTYVNIHHCPIWIDSEIFYSYVFSEDTYNYGKTLNEKCPEKIPMNLYYKPPKLPSIKDVIIEEKPPTIIENDPKLETNPVHGVVDIKIHGDYEFVVPPNVYLIKVYLWSAGGGGGGYTQIEIKEPNGKSYIIKSSGGGGGGGGHIVFYYPVTPGMTIPYTIGRGGRNGCSISLLGVPDQQFPDKYRWYIGDREINEQETFSLTIGGGEAGGSSIFGAHSSNITNALVIVYGGSAGSGSTINRFERTGNGGIGGNGSTGGIVKNTNIIKEYSIYGGNQGENGISITMGPEGPAAYGAYDDLDKAPLGGTSKILGAGKGGNGEYKLIENNVTGGQDGRIRIVW